MAGETDEQLDAVSRNLLESLGELKDLETRKRETARSTDEFHDLAERVSEKGQQVLDLAIHEEAVAEDDSPLAADHEDTGPGDWTRNTVEGLGPATG